MWAAYDWELNKVAHFLQTLYSIPIQTGVEDKMFGVWEEMFVPIRFLRFWEVLAA